MEQKDTSEQTAEVVEEEPAVQSADDTEVVEEQPADDEGPALPQANPDLTPAADPELVEAATPSFVYALGQIEFRFRTLGLEKEFAQVIARSGNEGMNDREAVKAAISADENRNLARGLCWVLLVEGLETYILLPRDPLDYTLLTEAVREDPRRDDIDMVIGTRGNLAPPDMCNGLVVPVLVFDQIYSFDRDSLIESIPAPESIKSKEQKAKFRQTTGGFFDHVMRMADNAGATDEHRALNYLAVRYPRIYATLAEEQERNASLAGIEVRQSPLSGVRHIVDVIFSFTHRQTDVTNKHFIRVDVTDEYPFLMTPLSPYYDVQ